MEPCATPTKQAISIHALLAESDANVACGDWHKLCDFYPRSPCGERRGANGCISAWNPISIHALLAESDSIFCAPPNKYE